MEQTITYCEPCTSYLSQSFRPSQVRNASVKTYVQRGNWVCVDMQNVYKGAKENGLKIDWLKFRNYLRNICNVTKAIIFIGYIPENRRLYNYLKCTGYHLEFRPVKYLSDGRIDGGNVDADLASYVMDHKLDYDKAIIVADDGDYFKTIQSLQRQNKLKLVISSHPLENTSRLIKSAISPGQLISIHDLRNQITQ